jgi:hypothetical protein
MNVTDARVRRMVERQEGRCCEVEVHTDREDSPGLLAYFGPSQDNDFDMVAIVQSDAKTEIDWYDNPVHSAFEEVTTQLFETSTMKTDWGRREAFKQQVLAYPGIRAELSRLLDRG